MKKLFKQGLVSSAVAIAAFASMSANAATPVTAQLNTSATISSACRIAAQDISFGTVTPAASGDVTATGNLTATCTNGTAYKITISAGNSGSDAARTMKGATGNNDVFAYNLYSDAAFANIWRSTEVDGVGGTGNGAAQTLTVHAKAPLNQYLKPDTYTDVLTVTLAY